MNSTTRIGTLLALAFIALAGIAQAVAQDAQELSLTLGDYRFEPDKLEAVAGTPVRLTLVNTDTMTPHNFTLEALRAGVPAISIAPPTPSARACNAGAGAPPQHRFAGDACNGGRARAAGRNCLPGGDCGGRGWQGLRAAHGASRRAK